MKTEIVGVSTLGGSMSYESAEAGASKEGEGKRRVPLRVDLAVRFAIELCGWLS